MPSLIQRIQAKLELMRLEKRYTRSRNRRSTFVSNAIYVDGEYIYQTPVSTGSSSDSSSSQYGTHINALHHEEPTAHAVDEPVSPRKDKKKRFSAMPGFGSTTESEGSSPWR